MLRHTCRERPHWKQLAEEFGFHFHTMHGEPYWCETGYYQFSLKQIEEDLEEPTLELHAMALEVVDRVVADEQLLQRCQIPEPFWDLVKASWDQQQPHLYGRIDLAYDGQSPAKLYEYNADTPTSLYETGFWQWLWLEQQVDAGWLPRQADQFNSVQEQLIKRFEWIAAKASTLHSSSPAPHNSPLLNNSPLPTLHLACCEGNLEDLGTITYLEDCAKEAGWSTDVLSMESIGVTATKQLTDLNDQPIQQLFKLYPWEMMMREDFAESLLKTETQFLEPLWKSILSNKALLPLLWHFFPNHPNLLPAYFLKENQIDPIQDNRLAKNRHALPGADQMNKLNQLDHYVIKPLFSREGANIQRFEHGKKVDEVPGPYGAEGSIVQAYHSLPKFGNYYTLIGSWLIGNYPAGISIREDRTKITKDSARFLPHIILS